MKNTAESSAKITSANISNEAFERLRRIVCAGFGKLSLEKVRVSLDRKEASDCDGTLLKWIKGISADERVVLDR